MTHKESLFFNQIRNRLKRFIRAMRLRFLPQSLFHRFILIILLPLLLLETIVMVFFYDRHWETISRRLARDISGEIQTVATFIVETQPTAAQLDTLFTSMEENLQLTMTYMPDSYLLPQQITSESSSSDLLSALHQLQYPLNMKELEGKRQMIAIQLPTGVLTTVLPRKRFFSSTVHVFLVWLIGSSLLLFWIAFLFMKNQVRSIERLSRASELFGRGQMDIDFHPSGATEVKQAGLSFILMKNRIQKYLLERTTMLAGVSHDLRTPLTRMKLQLSMMPGDETTTDLLADVTEMERMLSGYLSFAKGQGKEPMQPLQLDALVTTLVQKQKRGGQQITLHVEQPVQVLARENDLSRAIMNILNNAARYAKRTQVRLGIRNGLAVLVVDDNGPGIPPDKRNDVFKAFHRLEESRNTETGGVGLGMTIARDTFLSHGGDIALATSPAKGLRVTIRLPI